MANFGKVFNNTPVKKADVHPKKDVKWIHYTKLKESPYQYRDKNDKERRRENIISLAWLIDADGGVIEPLLVRKSDADEYEIIAGHTRRDSSKYLVEEEGKKQYEFLPCIVEKLSDVQAEWQTMSSNGYQDKTDYEKMHEIKRKKEILEQYPEEFPHLQTGRMVERLAKQMNIKSTSTVGEYLTIAKNLGDKGMEAFKTGELKKSAAVELSALPKEEQEELLENGVTSQKEIKAYKAEKEKKPEKLSAFVTRIEEQADVEPQVAGQLKISNTDMELIEFLPKVDAGKVMESAKELGGMAPDVDVANFGTQEADEVVLESAAQERKETVSFSVTQEIKEASEKLTEFIQQEKWENVMSVAERIRWRAEQLIKKRGSNE